MLSFKRPSVSALLFVACLAVSAPSVLRADEGSEGVGVVELLKGMPSPADGFYMPDDYQEDCEVCFSVKNALRSQNESLNVSLIAAEHDRNKAMKSRRTWRLLGLSSITLALGLVLGAFIL